jgi:hypothetical protein
LDFLEYLFESDNTTGKVVFSNYTLFQTTLASSDSFGYSVLTVDYDGDGDEELLVGAIGDDTQGSAAGRVVVYDNPGTPGTLLDNTADSYIYPSATLNYLCGSALAKGKYSNSSYDDLFIGCMGADVPTYDVGIVHQYAGSVTGVSASSTTISHPEAASVSSDYFGAAITILDMNRDGNNDLVIGAHQDDDPGVSAGSIFIFTE